MPFLQISPFYWGKGGSGLVKFVVTCTQPILLILSTHYMIFYPCRLFAQAYKRISITKKLAKKIIKKQNKKQPPPSSAYLTPQGFQMLKKGKPLREMLLGCSGWPMFMP